MFPTFTSHKSPSKHPKAMPIKYILPTPVSAILQPIQQLAPLESRFSTEYRLPVNIEIREGQTIRFSSAQFPQSTYLISSTDSLHSPLPIGYRSFHATPSTGGRRITLHQPLRESIDWLTDQWEAWCRWFAQKKNLFVEALHAHFHPPSSPQIPEFDLPTYTTP